MDNTGTKIRNRRKELGFKVYELAEKVGVNPVYITQIEKHNKLPSIEIFKKISKALDLPEQNLPQYYSEKYPSLIYTPKLIEDMENLPDDGLDLVNEILEFFPISYPNKGFKNSFKKEIKNFTTALIKRKNPSLLSNNTVIECIEKALEVIVKSQLDTTNLQGNEIDKIEKLLNKKTAPPSGNNGK